jgi:xyloglucan-specific exo-beta-1,4-glucanase
MRSMDQGKTFQVVAVPFRMGANEFGRSAGERLAIDPNDNNILYFGSRHNGLWVSKDAALSWVKVENFTATASDSAGQGGRSRGGVGLSFVFFDANARHPGQRHPGDLRQRFRNVGQFRRVDEGG